MEKPSEQRRCGVCGGPCADDVIKCGACPGKLEYDNGPDKVMRKIKFRGKITGDGAWVEGDLVHNACDGTFKRIAMGIRSDNCCPIEVDPDSVGVFVGLKDKNGVECYVGDAYTSDSGGGNLWVMCMEDNQLRFCSKLINPSPSVEYFIRDFHSEMFAKDATIVGNIHDNPELLEKGSHG